ncbi:M16 family metallopeptidase [Clostridium thermarum]|uniref:M16 family metallopeptidase n=1 Tax=Clostridium thermarum TaxID=1716543 RepID=UPI001124895E|nr:pitrilysin family protein [Clostridium thermarum]
MYNMITLSNGLRLVIEKIDYVNSVSVGLWIENGSRNEAINNNGISHFIEHMLFKGTRNRSAKELAEVIEDVGGQLNAFTGKEATCFYIKLLDTHLELSLDVLSDMLFNSIFSEEEIEREKGVVIEEINMSEDTPDDVVNELHSQVTWGEDSLSLPILGTEETVRSFTRAQLIDYVHSYYIPENSVISICGNVDISNVEKLVEAYFGKWKSDTKKITHYSSPEILTGSLYKNKDIEQLHISLGLKGIPMGNDDIYPLLLLNNVLGGGASSLLFQKIREEHGLCYTVYSYLSSYINTGVINIYAGLNPNYAADALVMISQEIEDFIKTGIREEKLIKAKEQIKGNYILGLESTSSRMFSNGKAALFQNRINRPDEILKKIDAITTDKLNEVMKVTFGNRIMNAAFVGKNINIDQYNEILNFDTVAFKQNTTKELV